jgi:carboxypeptidase Q
MMTSRQALWGILCTLGVSGFPATVAHAQADSAIAAAYRETANRIIQAATADSAAWERIALLTDTFGSRIAGSTALEQAIDWIVGQMKTDRLDSVRTQPATVPYWVRGKESAELVEPRHVNLPMLGLGGSIGTPPEGITAEVLVVSSFDDLHMRAGEAAGKIVLFDAPFTDYGTTGRYRWRGAVEAARAGAVACLIRSITPFSISSPHTGEMAYDSTVTRIPAAALTIENAMMLHRMQDRGQRVVATLQMEAARLPDAQSRNVMGQITGREKPGEVVVMGGHIDSWDVGEGAMDDAGGMVAAWQALRVLQQLGLHPRRTIRVVGWTAEENSAAGGAAYRDSLGDNVAHHVFAIESDGGVFRPLGFGFTGSDSALAILRQIGHLLAPIGADTVAKGGGEADIEPLMKAGVPGAGLYTDGDRYFWFHHTQGDMVTVLDPADVARCAAAMAVLAYVVADMPGELPR